MIAGLSRPTRGTILVDGTSPTHLRGGRWSPVAAFRRSVVYVDPGILLARHRPLDSDETTLDWIVQSGQAFGYDRQYGRQAGPGVLEMVGLGGQRDAPAGTLSGGQKQRLAVAIAIIARPSVTLFDEPFGAMDPDTCIEVARTLDRVNRTGTTIICATNNSNVVNLMRRRVIELEAGRIVRDQPRGVYG